MTFKNYLLTKKNFLIIFFLINAFALFVNIFKIEGKIEEGSNVDSERQIIKNHCTPKGYSYEACSYSSWVYLWTAKEEGSNHENGFWPIVKFYSDFSYGINPTTKIHMHNGSFNGIFYQYDISEFIAYSLLIFVILYFIWNNKVNRLKTNSV